MAIACKRSKEQLTSSNKIGDFIVDQLLILKDELFGIAPLGPPILWIKLLVTRGKRDYLYVSILEDLSECQPRPAGMGP